MAQKCWFLGIKLLVSRRMSIFVPRNLCAKPPAPQLQKEFVARETVEYLSIA